MGKKKNKNERKLWYPSMKNIGSNMTELDITAKLKNW